MTKTDAGHDGNDAGHDGKRLYEIEHVEAKPPHLSSSSVIGLGNAILRPEQTFHYPNGPRNVILRPELTFLHPGGNEIVVFIPKTALFVQTGME